MFARITSRVFFPYAVLILMTLLVAVLTSVYLINNGISYREVIVGLCLLAGLRVALAGRQGLKLGLLFLVATFGLGYRTMSITPSVPLHPSELVVVALFGLLIVQQAIDREFKFVVWLPTWLILLAPFCLLGWRTLFSGNVRWEFMFLEFKNFLMFVPLLLVASVALGEKRAWRSVLLAFYLVGVWVAAMGLVEYIFPEVKALLPGFVSDPVPRQTGEGFERAAFSFWGTSDAVYVCVLALPMSVAFWHWWSASWTRVLNLLLVVMMLGGVYISGHRNAWLMITVQFFTLLLIKKQYLMGGAILIVFLLAFQFLPSAAKDRIYSGAELLSGQPLRYDTSGQKRWDRALTALNDSLEEPLGRGWAAAGWVHNDYLQVAENLGLTAGVLFLGSFIFTLQRLWFRLRAVSPLGAQRISGTALLLSFMSAGMILATEAALVLPQLILPIWFTWACVEIWLRQTRVTRPIRNDDTYSTIGAIANLQLRDDRARYVRGG